MVLFGGEPEELQNMVQSREAVGKSVRFHGEQQVGDGLRHLNHSSKVGNGITEGQLFHSKVEGDGHSINFLYDNQEAGATYEQRVRLTVGVLGQTSKTKGSRALNEVAVAVDSKDVHADVTSNVGCITERYDGVQCATRRCVEVSHGPVVRNGRGARCTTEKGDSCLVIRYAKGATHELPLVNKENLKSTLTQSIRYQERGQEKQPPTPEHPKS